MIQIIDSPLILLAISTAIDISITNIFPFILFADNSSIMFVIIDSTCSSLTITSTLVLGIILEYISSYLL